MRLSVSISTIFGLFVSFSTFCALIPCWGFLIVRVINFLQAFEENSLFAVYKTVLIESKKKLERNFKIPQDGLHLQLLFYELAKFDGVRLKIERALVLCIAAVLTKTCLEKFTPKVRRTSYNLLPAKTLARHISQPIRRIENNFFY